MDANLTRLISALENWRAVKKISPSAKDEHKAVAFAQKLPLAHSTASQKALDIAKGGKLLSFNRLVEMGKVKSPAKPNTEQQLNTSDAVFMFVGTFSSPHRSNPVACGFLWAAELEAYREADGDASPFDSGGLKDHYQRSDPDEPPEDFLDRHRLPLVRHRDYLAKKMVAFFADPVEYLCDASASGAACDDPIVGLKGGDRRRWTHEVRIRHEVELRTHLLAAFLPRKVAVRMHGAAAALSAQLGEHFVVYEDDEGSFEGILESCTEFLNGYMGTAR